MSNLIYIADEADKLEKDLEVVLRRTREKIVMAESAVGEKKSRLLRKAASSIVEAQGALATFQRDVREEIWKERGK